jgi:hypothetical protein
MERSKIPLNKWLLAMYLMGASKKGISIRQLGRVLDITYPSAWLLAHRIRDAICTLPNRPTIAKESLTPARPTSAP